MIAFSHFFHFYVVVARSQDLGSVVLVILKLILHVLVLRSYGWFVCVWIQLLIMNDCIFLISLNCFPPLCDKGDALWIYLHKDIHIILRICGCRTFFVFCLVAISTELTHYISSPELRIVWLWWNAGKQQEWTWEAWQREACWLLEHVEGVCA